MTTTPSADNQPFVVADQEKIEKAQKIISMVKEQDSFTQEEADELLGFISEKLGLSSDRE